jgi:tripartite-type tricarboxylate transporter receptor subunit TctC
MTGTLSQSVWRRSGAGGTTGSEYVARAEPDCYTLIAGTQSTHAINVGL